MGTLAHGGTDLRSRTVQPATRDLAAVYGAAAVVETTGSIDVLFNALGMEDSQGTALLDMSLEEFAHPVRSATRAPFLTARAVARHMQGARTVGAL